MVFWKGRRSHISTKWVGKCGTRRPVCSLPRSEQSRPRSIAATFRMPLEKSVKTLDPTDDPGLNWYDFDDEDVERSNTLFKTLVDELAHHHVRDESAVLRLHVKLLSTWQTQRVQRAINSVIKPEKSKDLARECRELESAARNFAERIERAAKARFVDSCLVLAYRQVYGAHPAGQGVRGADGPKQWTSFQRHLHEDAKRMERIAAAARVALAAHTGRSGRPPQLWRNTLINALVEDLNALIPDCSQECIAEIASNAWEIYFGHDDGYEDAVTPEAIRRNVTRYQGRKKKSRT